MLPTFVESVYTYDAFIDPNTSGHWICHFKISRCEHKLTQTSWVIYENGCEDYRGRPADNILTWCLCPVQFLPSYPVQFEPFVGPFQTQNTQKIVHFLKLAEDVDHDENHVDRIPWDMISKCIKFVRKKVCNTRFWDLFDTIIWRLMHLDIIFNDIRPT